MPIEPRKILLVEDSAHDVELTLEALGAHNLANAVDIARDGEEALDYLYRREKFLSRVPGNPAVVLLDIKLPKVDGHEVLTVIKSDEHLRLIPVVMLSSSRESRDVAEAYRRGANAYLVKPVDFHAFIDVMKIVGAFWAVLNETAPLGAR